jgi:hypothetical protein
VFELHVALLIRAIEPAETLIPSDVLELQVTDVNSADDALPMMIPWPPVFKLEVRELPLNWLVLLIIIPLPPLESVVPESMVNIELTSTDTPVDMFETADMVAI